MALPGSAEALAPPLLGQKKAAAKPGKGKDKGKEKEEEATPGVLKKKVAPPPRGVKWGMSNEQIARVYDKVFDEEFVPLYKKVQPGPRMEALDEELANKKQLLRRSRLEFGETPTGVDQSELNGEYSYRNNESMSKIRLRSGAARNYFFFEDRLWKVYEEYKLKKRGTLGETYKDALQILTKKFGVAPIVLAADPEAQRPFDEALWHDGATYVRVVNREHAKIVGVVWVDKSIQDNLATYRKNKAEDPRKTDKDVEHATRKQEEPPPADKGKKPQ
ncbi:MAG: hypothetical protein IT376_22635 [Polyangiaceae bacterium]|nr:hypothetical protein [Polyangiaceae bacterium]